MTHPVVCRVGVCEEGKGGGGRRAGRKLGIENRLADTQSIPERQVQERGVGMGSEDDRGLKTHLNVSESVRGCLTPSSKIKVTCRHASMRTTRPMELHRNAYSLLTLRSRI